MVKTRPSAEEIRDFILNNVTAHPSNISRMTADELNITRQTASKHVMGLVRDGQLRVHGKTKATTYELVQLLTHDDGIAITPKIEEDVTWRDAIMPYLKNVPSNVLEICQYGFTEMVNNVVSHSNGTTMGISVTRNAVLITLLVSDDGVGVFNKIQQTLGLQDPRHALLELSKGKVTSDPDQHTGEGIFFTSRMFDTFSIGSGSLFYVRVNQGDDWLVEVRDQAKFEGTAVRMEIHLNSSRTSKEIFDNYASGDSYDFSKTHVPILLAKYDQEQLLSRSQAKRVLGRFDRFREVMLDFQGVDTIGRSFADEIFRVYRHEHPEIAIYVVNVSKEIEQMISRASSDAVQILSRSS